MTLRDSTRAARDKISLGYEGSNTLTQTCLGNEGLRRHPGLSLGRLAYPEIDIGSDQPRRRIKTGIIA